MRSRANASAADERDRERDERRRRDASSPPRSPISQNSMPFTCASGASVSISAISAPQPAATTTPVSSSRVVVQGARSPPVRASPNTSSVEASAPPSAAGVASAAAPASIAPSAPTAAPPEMPRMYGSASGLRSSTCISAPASASRPPTANAASARGSRNSRTIAASRVGRVAGERANDRGRVDATLPDREASAERERGRSGERDENRDAASGGGEPGNGGADMARRRKRLAAGVRGGLASVRARV